jgi:hypothetical protein
MQLCLNYTGILYLASPVQAATPTQADVPARVQPTFC